MATIRPYRTSDRERVYDICVRTGADGADASGHYDRPVILAEIYAGPYLTLRPELAWVIDSGVGGDDEVIGYILGADDTAAFESECERSWWPEIRTRYPLSRSAARSADSALLDLIHHPRAGVPAVIREYPAHLHVDILPVGAGTGFGAALVRTLCAELAKRGVRGIHLGVSGGNSHAIGFYEHLGFVRLGAEFGVPADEFVFGLKLENR